MIFEKSISMKGKVLTFEDISKIYKLVQFYCGDDVNIEFFYSENDRFDNYGETITHAELESLFEDKIIKKIIIKPIGKSKTIIKIDISTYKDISIFIQTESAEKKRVIINELSNLLNQLANNSKFYIIFEENFVGFILLLLTISLTWLVQMFILLVPLLTVYGSFEHISRSIIGFFGFIFTLTTLYLLKTIREHFFPIMIVQNYVKRKIDLKKIANYFIRYLIIIILGVLSTLLYELLFK